MTGERWVPDEQLIPRYLAPPPYPTGKLTTADRCWVVAGLTLADRTAEDIAERLGCSLRLVRTIRADPMTQVCVFYQTEVSTFEAELRMANSDHRNLAAQLNETEAELARAKRQLARLINPAAAGEVFMRCGHEKTRYNVYEWTDSRGKVKQACRTCHAKRESDRRASRQAPC